MAFHNSQYKPSYWATVGLGFTTILFGLASYTAISPGGAADLFQIVPQTPLERVIADKAMYLLSVRDLAISAALFVFYRNRQLREMGVIITSWTLVFAVDTWIAAQGERDVDDVIVGLCIATGLVAFAGLGMWQM